MIYYMKRYSLYISKIRFSGKREVIIKKVIIGQSQRLHSTLEFGETLYHLWYVIKFTKYTHYMKLVVLLDYFNH